MSDRHDAAPPREGAGSPSAPSPPSAHSRPPVGRRRRIPALLVITLVLAMAILGGGTAAWWSALATERPFKGWSGDEVFVEIPQGASVSSIARRLADAGVVQQRLIFRLAAWRGGAERQLKAGEYRFDRPISPRHVAEKIARGEVYFRPVTFREGLAIDEMAGVFEQQGLGTREEFIEAAGNAALVRDIDPAAKDLEGYLFPDTYQLPRTATAPQLVQSMVDRFRAIATPEMTRAAADRGYSMRQWVTLASIVEKETGRDDERPLVAAVYGNRVRIGMGLQCDPTVIYALKKAGQWDGNLTRDNLQIDSPYNTYRYAGLPPGPIASPGRASLEAVTTPADTGYLYFVSRNDGTHAFASTLEEHNANVRRFQLQYFREKRAGR